MYANIIFQQSFTESINLCLQEGHAIHSVLQAWHNLSQISSSEDEIVILEYLKQWDYGKDSEYDLSDTILAGTKDTVKYYGEYVLSYNTALDYVGLERKI